MSDEVTTKIQEYRRDKGDLSAYYYCSGDLLRSIFHSFECCANSALCSNSSHELDIEIYYSEIIHALTIAADGTVPKVAKSAFKHYWSAALTDLNSGVISLNPWGSTLSSFLPPPSPPFLLLPFSLFYLFSFPSFPLSCLLLPLEVGPL